MQQSRRWVPDELITRLRRIKLQTRLLATFLAVSLIPVLFIGVYAYRIYTDSVNDKVGEYAEQSTKLLNKTLQLELERYSAYINSLSVTSAVQRMAVPSPENSSGFSVEERKEIEKTIANMATSGLYLRDIQIIDRSGSILYGPGYESSASSQYQAFLSDIDRVSPKDSLRYASGLHTTGNLVLGRKIYHYGTGIKHAGYILIYINAKLLHDHIFQGLDFGPDSKIYLMASDGVVLASNEITSQGTSFAEKQLYERLQQSAQEGGATFSVEQDGIGYLGVFSHSTQYDSYFVALVPNSYIANETRSITTSLVLLAILLFAASFVTMLLIYYSITLPIQNMIAVYKATPEDDSRLRLEDKSPDEIGFLARTLEHLMAEQRRMVRRWQDDQVRKRELELESLQYQINPHFLFNTLNTLQWVASLNEVPALYESLGSLSALLQNTLIKKDEFITIQEELNNLAHYVSIQRVRYAGCFDVEYRIDEALAGCNIPRFILQPLVENAIIHSADDSGRVIQITISCERIDDNTIQVCVADDGKGFELEQNALPIREKFSGIGLSNVDERLKLYYGEAYGLKVISQVSVGTICTIHLPAGPIQLEKNDD